MTYREFAQLLARYYIICLTHTLDTGAWHVLYDVPGDSVWLTPMSYTFTNEEPR